MLATSIYMQTAKRGQSESPQRLLRPKYVNEAIELELIIFKREIEEKFAKSKVNREFKYPRLPNPIDEQSEPY